MHPRQPHLEDLESWWGAACEDACVASDGVLLYQFNDDPGGGLQAAEMWAPGERSGIPAANDPECIDSFRILVRRGHPIVERVARLRHELEHCRQIREFPWLADVHRVLRENDRLDNVLYNAMPMERDANQAASVFARSQFNALDIDERLRAGTLEPTGLRAFPPRASVGTLPERMRCFVELYRHEWSDVDALLGLFPDRPASR